MVKKLLASTVAFLSVMVFASTAVHAFWYAPPEDEEVFVRESPIQRLMAPRPDEYPVRLTIPSLDIDTKVQHVGITAKGTMSVPNNFKDVGWYKYGVAAGQRGSAVMAGHVDNAVGLPGVFKHLAELHVGDDVYVERKDGSTLHFVVQEVKSYSISDAPLGKIFGRDDASYLNLITCEGDWVQSERQYDRRLVVYTRLVGDAPSQPKTQTEVLQEQAQAQLRTESPPELPSVPVAPIVEEESAPDPAEPAVEDSPIEPAPEPEQESSGNTPDYVPEVTDSKPYSRPTSTVEILP